MSILLEPFAFPFFARGIAVATLAGVLCGLVGVYVVLRGMSYIGHGLSHAIFGGAVASFITGVNFYLGAGAWGVLAALLINRVSRRRSLGADAAIGVVTTASFALGLALISTATTGFTRNFEAALFGSALGVTTGDLVAVGIVAALVAGFVFLAYRPLLFLTFDVEVASVSGVPTARLDALFALGLAATIVATMRILGVTLIAAALVIPPATARMLTDSFHRMLWLSIALGGLSGFGGMYLSWYLDAASGASIVLLQAALFVAAYAMSGVRRTRRRLPASATRAA